MMYVNETSWMTELVRFGPTIALLAAYFFISRNAGGMMGGGPNNVFKIGKSTAKKINKEMVTATSPTWQGVTKPRRRYGVHRLLEESPAIY